ncbi:hypothetical protein HDU93_004521 [Gonapodya sp. JEL0774]|nr:hypothetical protein HDU93_004521 [Gonapodya sp. JEL0774]
MQFESIRFGSVHFVHEYQAASLKDVEEATLCGSSTEIMGSVVDFAKVSPSAMMETIEVVHQPHALSAPSLEECAELSCRLVAPSPVKAKTWASVVMSKQPTTNPQKPSLRSDASRATMVNTMLKVLDPLVFSPCSVTHAATSRIPRKKDKLVTLSVKKEPPPPVPNENFTRIPTKKAFASLSVLATSVRDKDGFNFVQKKTRPRAPSFPRLQVAVSWITQGAHRNKFAVLAGRNDVQEDPADRNVLSHDPTSPPTSSVAAPTIMPTLDPPCATEVDAESTRALAEASQHNQHQYKRWKEWQNRQRFCLGREFEF